MAPAAICRKIIEAKLSGRHEIEDRGVRHADAQLHVHLRLPEGHARHHRERHPRAPSTWGSSELVTINQLVDIVEHIAGIKVKRGYKLDAPKGVNGRNSDNARIRQALGWEPAVSLRTASSRPIAGSTTR